MQTTFVRARAYAFLFAIVIALAATAARAQPDRNALTIDGSDAARFEASVAAIQNDLRTSRRQEFETALAAIWFTDTSSSGDADRDSDHDAEDLKSFREDAFDLLTNIQRGNVANAIEQRAANARTATDYFRRLDGLGSDEVIELASRPEAAAYLAPLWKYRHDELCKRAYIDSVPLRKNCRPDTGAAQIFDIPTAKALNAAIDALRENRYDEARSALARLNVKRLVPYEASKVEQILFNVALGEQNYAEAREHLQNALDAGGLSLQESSMAAAQIHALDAALAASAP